jgi:hypothetical protein
MCRPQFPGAFAKRVPKPNEVGCKNKVQKMLKKYRDR